MGFEPAAGGVWKASAAFTISERQLSDSAFSSNEVISFASVGSRYPGCPHYGSDSEGIRRGVPRQHELDTFVRLRKREI
jgi:hypothetical protein